MTEPVETTEPVEQDPQVEGVETTPGEPATATVDPFKSKWEAQRKVNRDLEKKLLAAEQALADKDKPAEEAALDQARREATQQAVQAANQRIVKAELKAALTGKVANPAVAMRLIDTAEIAVSDDGEVDADALSAAVESLLIEAPELAAKGTRFPGSADQGQKSAAPQQLTQTDIESMTPEQIVEARKAGRLNKLLGVE